MRLIGVMWAAALALTRRAAAQAPALGRTAGEADSVARNAGWPVHLGEASMAAGDSELRVYLALGSSAPARAVRIARRAGQVTGALALWWPGTTLRFDVPDDPERPIAQHDQEIWVAAMRARARALGCGPVVEGGWVESCVLEKSPRVDWRKTLAEFEAAGLARTESRRVGPSIDGTWLYVQLRSGARISSYTVRIPEPGSRDPADRAVTRFIEALRRLF